MEKEILNRLTILGHPKRMAVFRLLVRRYPDAVPAGELARALCVKPSTLSVYLSALTAVGLIDKTRYATSIHYRARLDAVRNIVDFIFRDCCHNRPQICPQPEVSSALGVLGAEGRKRNVIFICTGNSARSIMAESILRHAAGDRFNVYSAGTRPTGQPNPLAIDLLRAKGHDTGLLRSKNLEEFQADDAPQMNFVLTVCDHAANEECPIWPGHPIGGHWGIPDPAAVTGSLSEKQQAFARAYAQMHACVLAFVRAMDGAGMDVTALQNHIDQIGQMPTPTKD